MLNSTAKKRIAETTGMNPRTLDNRLQELAKSGILDRVAVGTYVLNPYLFGKGDWKSISALRNQNIHLERKYDSKTGKRIIKGKIDKKPVDTKETACNI
jgi:DNA-binding GntR family transcriptional regulator